MTKATETHVNHTVLGAGEVYIDVLNADGSRTGERYVGDSTGARISAATQRTTIYGGDGAVAPVLLDRITSLSHTMVVTIQDMSVENIALFLAGDVQDLAQINTAVAYAAPEEFLVQKGRWYQLGVKTGQLAGAHKVKSATLKFSVTAKGAAKPAENTFKLASDASIEDKIVADPDRGRFFYKPDADADQKVWVIYEPDVPARKGASAGALKEIKAAVRYIEDAAGDDKGSNWYIRQATIGASGETALKDRTTPQSVGLQVLVEVPAIAAEAGHPAILVDGAAFTSS